MGGEGANDVGSKSLKKKKGKKSWNSNNLTPEEGRKTSRQRKMFQIYHGAWGRGITTYSETCKKHKKGREKFYKDIF